MPGFTVLAVPYFFQAGQSRTSLASPLSMFIATAPPRDRADDDLGLVLVELGLGDLDGLGEVFVGQCRVDDLVAVLRQEGRLDAARDRLPAVEEEDFHDARLHVASCRAREISIVSGNFSTPACRSMLTTCAAV